MYTTLVSVCGAIPSNSIIRRAANLSKNSKEGGEQHDSGIDFDSVQVQVLVDLLSAW